MACLHSWSISGESLRRYVLNASENCIQDLLWASESGRSGVRDDWKILSLRDGVEISKRRTGALHVFRSRILLQSVSAQQFVAVANAAHTARQWDRNLVETEYIKTIGDNLSIIRLGFAEDSKTVLKNREFIVYERREKMDDGTVVVAVASLPKEIAAGLIHEKSNKIRGMILQSGWVVEKTEENYCMGTYVVQLDPLGWLPRCLVNRLNIRLVMIGESLGRIAQG